MNIPSSLIHKCRLRWEHIFAAAALGVLLFYMLELLVPMRWLDIYNNYGLVAIGFMAGAWFAKRGFSGAAEVKIFLLFVVWALVSRWLNGDIYLFIDLKLVLSLLLGFLLFAAGTALCEKACGIFLDLLTLIYSGFFLLVALASIFVFLTDTYIHIPPENVWITILNEGGMNSLNALSTHRLIAVGRFFLAACLVVYQFVKRKNIIVRILCLLAYITLHMAIALCHARTTHIAMCVGFAMLMLLAFIPVFEKRSKPLRFAALPIIAALSLLVFYKSFDVCDLAVARLREATVPAFETYYNSLEVKPNEEYFGTREFSAELSAAAAAEEKAAQSSSGEEPAAAVTPSPKPVKESVVDNRKLLGNWTFTGRTEIWESGIIAIKENPRVALFGESSKDFMKGVNHILRSQVNPSVKEYKNHMHNSFMQVLMLFGVPGLLLVLAWTVLMVKNMLRLFFSKMAPLHDKFLTVPLAGVFVISLAEVFIFGSLDTITIVFYLIAGAFLSRYYEIMKN